MKSNFAIYRSFSYWCEIQIHSFIVFDGTFVFVYKSISFDLFEIIFSILAPVIVQCSQLSLEFLNQFPSQSNKLYYVIVWLKGDTHINKSSLLTNKKLRKKIQNWFI